MKKRKIIRTNLGDLISILDKELVSSGIRNKKLRSKLTGVMLTDILSKRK